MRRLVNGYLLLAFWAEHRLAPVLMPTLARLIFAAILARYFWASAMTKAGMDFGGLLSPSARAVAQILPRRAEALGYDVSRLSGSETLIVLAGTWAEFLLPALLLLGLFTGPAALGMVIFVVVQTLTDIHGHGVADAASLGAWFDTRPDAPIMDQRALWLVPLLVLVTRGAGPLSLDHLLKRRLRIR